MARDDTTALMCNAQREMRCHRHFLAALVGVAIGSVATGGRAAAQSVPAPLQAAFLRRIFAYDHGLSKAKERHHVAFVRGNDASTAEVATALADMDVRVTHIDVGDMASLPSDVVAIYVNDGRAASEVSAYCRKTSRLSLTGDPELVIDGLISIGVGINDQGKARVFVNLTSLAAERHTLDSRLLALAEVYGMPPRRD